RRRRTGWWHRRRPAGDRPTVVLRRRPTAPRPRWADTPHRAAAQAPVTAALSTALSGCRQGRGCCAYPCPSHPFGRTMKSLITFAPNQFDLSAPEPCLGLTAPAMQDWLGVTIRLLGSEQDQVLRGQERDAVVEVGRHGPVRRVAGVLLVDNRSHPFEA